MFDVIPSLGILCLVLHSLTSLVDVFLSIGILWGFRPQSRCCLHSSSNLVVDDLVAQAALAAPVEMAEQGLSNQTSLIALSTFALSGTLPSVPYVLRFALPGLLAETVWSA